MSESDEKAALGLIASFPLDRTNGGLIDLTFAVPDDAQWRRIRQEWGDTGYVVAIASKGHIECRDEAADSMRITAGQRTFALETTKNALYGYSIENCPAFEWLVRASPGSIVQIHGNISRLQTGDALIVAPYWTFAVKDRLAGLQLRQQVNTFADATAGAGAICLVFGCFVLRPFTFALVQPRRSKP